jgi:hypothetical protein
MSWELTIKGGKTIALGAWQARLRRLGASVEFHPQFGMYRSNECFAIALTILPEARFSDAARFAQASPVRSYLQFEIEEFGTLDRGVSSENLLTELDTRIARLGELGAPDIILEHARARRASLVRALADEPGEQRVYISAPEGHLLAHTLCSAAYALASGGTLHPLDRGGSVAGDEVLGWLTERFTTYALSAPEPFPGWE